MPKLIAEFQVALSGQCFVSVPNSRQLSFEIKVQEFDVNFEFFTCQKLKRGEGEDWISIIEKVILQVGREEDEMPPEIPQKEDGVRDYTIQDPYFSQRIENYRAVACEAMNRMVAFFKFQLNTPFLEEFHQYGNELGLPKWIDSNGKEVGKGAMIFFAYRIPGLWGELDVRSLLEDDISKFQLALERPGEPKIYEQVLIGAREAIFDNKLRRAVVELAMACEILVKERFFSGNIPALVAIGDLEDRGRVQLRVLDLIDRVSLEIFDQSFRVNFPDDFKHIDYLFRCRNKVVHQGKLFYRNNDKEENPDEETLKRWWKSVRKLEIWIKELFDEKLKGN